MGHREKMDGFNFELGEIKTPVRYSCIDIQQAAVRDPGTQESNAI